MRLIPRVALFASAATLALPCLGIGFVASRSGPLATLFEPASASVPAPAHAS
jgi:hypothetical protein